MIRLFYALLAALLLGVPVAGAQAKPVTDCPLRNLPFTADSPLIDVMLSEQARAILNTYAHGRFATIPQGIFGVRPPTFAAIWTIRNSTRFTGLSGADVVTADRELRALPVTKADRIARCARYDNDVPSFDLPAGKPRILVFEKINGFKDEPSVNAARAAIEGISKRKGWPMATTDRGGVMNARSLRQFDMVVWNNISGDVLTLSQRKALRRFVEQGGGFLAIHGAAGDPVYYWDWFADSLIGARFLGHPRDPQFQNARIVVDPKHGLASGLPSEWTMNDEWYSFSTNPRNAGAKVLLTLDENSYKPLGAQGADLRMGEHPIAWTNCIGPNGRKKGRMFYSAIGHRPETYSDPHYVAVLEAALEWAANRQADCH